MATDVLRVSPSECIDQVIMCMHTRLTPMIWGSPAIGKSSIVRQIAQRFKLWLIDVRLSQYDPTDLHGFPKIDGRRSTYLPMDTFPLEDDPIPEGYNGFLIFFDEFSSAVRMTAAAAYKVVLDKYIGNRKLHPKAIIVCAGNMMTDGAIVNQAGTAMQSRLIHLELMVDWKEWSIWASSEKLSHRVISYINHRPAKLYQFNPTHNDKTFASPRTWEFASRIDLYPKLTMHQKLPALAGAVSEGVAREFVTYCDVYSHIPTYQQIIANPLSISMSDEPSMLAAIAGMIGSSMTVADLPKIMRYINRLPIEFQVFALRDGCKRNPAMLREKELISWLNTNGDELY